MQETLPTLFGSYKLKGRTRLATEIIAAVRAAVGSDFPTSIRFSQWKQTDFDARIAETPDELEQYLTPWVKAGVDILHPSTRRFWEPAFKESDLSMAGWAKKIIGKTTIAVGSVGIDTVYVANHFMQAEPFETRAVVVDQVEEKLAKGEFDLIAVGRAILADAEWPNKMQHGQLAAIRPFATENLTSPPI